MPTKLKKIISILAIVASFIVPLAATAQDLNLGLDKAQEIGLPAGGSTGSLTDVVVQLIRLFLSFMGLLLVLIIIYAGFMWMLSMGNEEKTAQAKRTIISAIVGMILILLSYAIVNFVINGITSSLNGTTPSSL